MLVKSWQVLLAFLPWVVLVTVARKCDCGNAVFPYEFCTVPFPLTYQYQAKVNASHLYSAQYYRSNIWKMYSIEAKCGKQMLDVTVKRSSNPSPIMPSFTHVVYNISVGIKKIYRYNYTTLNNLSKSEIDNCVGELKHLENYFDAKLLYLNISGNIQQATLYSSPELKDCPLGTVCPVGSNETSHKTCVALAGWYCSNNHTDRPVRCPQDTYQNKSGMCSCLPCPDGGTTVHYGVNSSSYCSRATTPGPTTVRTTSTTYGITTSPNKDDEENNVLQIVLPLVVLVVVVLLVLAISKVLWTKYRRRKYNRRFKEIFQLSVHINPQFVEDEVHINPQFVEDGPELSLRMLELQDEITAKNMEIPREKLKLTGTRLGRGHFGEVHQALLKQDDQPEMLCAVKKARAGCHISIEDILEEISVHLKMEIEHPNVVNLLGICSSSDGPFYMVVEYCNYGSLSDFLKENKETPDYVNAPGKAPLSLEWRARRSLEVCSGMKHLSSRKIVHRDLAARNVLLDHNMVAKVSDFGMAKDVYVKSYYQQNHEGAFPLRWMSIEAIQKFYFTEKTDIWSYGVTVWEIFSEGSLPYYFIINDEKVASYILSGKTLKRPKKCPKSLFRIISKCWKDKPYNRPTFTQLNEDLNGYVKYRLSEVEEPKIVRKGSSIKRRFQETRRSLTRKLSTRQSSTASLNSVAAASPRTRKQLPDPASPRIRKQLSDELNHDITSMHSLDSVDEDKVLETGLSSEDECEEYACKQQLEAADPCTSKQQLEAADSCTSKQQLEAADPCTSKQLLETADSCTSKQQLEAADPCTSKQQLETADPCTSKQQLEAADPCTSKQQLEAADPCTSKQLLETADSCTSKQLLETADSCTSKQQLETADSCTSKQQLEAADPCTSKQQLEAADSCTSKQLLETADSCTSKQLLETADPCTSKQLLETADSCTSKQQLEAADSCTSKQHLEAADPCTSKQLLETADPCTSKQQLEAADPCTSKQLLETADPCTSKQQLEAADPCTSKQQLETADSCTSKQQLDQPNDDDTSMYSVDEDRVLETGLSSEDECEDERIQRQQSTEHANIDATSIHSVDSVDKDKLLGSEAAVLRSEDECKDERIQRQQSTELANNDATSIHSVDEGRVLGSEAAVLRSEDENDDQCTGE